MVKGSAYGGIGSENIRVSFADSSSLDAFGRLRVAEPFTVFDSKQIFDNQPLFWDESSGVTDITSAHSVNTASTVITYDGGATGGTFTRQTFMRFNYQPGKSQSIMMTGVLEHVGGGTGITRRIGYFDDDNGLFFEDDQGTVSVVRRTNVTGTPVDNSVDQSSWNIDKMDGSGPSGVDIDWTKTQLFTLDFEWLGVGRVRMGLVVDGIVFYVHEFLTGNVLSKIYMSTPNLPCRYQLVAVANSAVSSMDCMCATVISEGGVSDLGTIRYQSTEGTHVDTSVVDTVYALVGIRLKSDRLGAEIKILSVSAAEISGGKVMEWLLLFNPTVAGTFTYSDFANSAVQTAVGAIANTVTGGTPMGGSHFFSDNRGGATAADLDTARRLGAAIDGTVDEIVLCVRPINGANSDTEGAITWREVP